MHKKNIHQAAVFFVNCLFIFFLSGFTIISTISLSQQLPTRPNKLDALGKPQGDWIIFFDHKFEPVTAPEKAVYYRLIAYQNGNPFGKTTDYYRNGVKQWEGELISEHPDVFEGLQTWYWENGAVKIQEVYKNNEPVGDTKVFLRTGQPANFNWEVDYYNPALEAQEANDDKTAIGFFEEALPHVEALIGRESEEYADIIFWLSLLQSAVGNRGSVLARQMELVAIYKTIRQPADKDLLEALFNLSYSYVRLLQWEKAEATLNEYFEQESKHVQAFDENHGYALIKLGEVYLETARYAQAVKPLEQALAHYEKYPPEQKEEMELARTNLTRARTLTGAWAKGKELMLMEMAEAKKSSGEQSERYLFALSGLGNYNRMSGRLKESEQNYLTLLSLMEKHKVDNLSLIMSGIIPIMDVYINLGQPHLCEKFIKQGEKIFANTSASNDGYEIMHINFLKRVSMYYRELGKEKEAIATFEELVTASKKIVPLTSDYSYGLSAYAEYLLLNRKYEQALKKLLEAEAHIRNHDPAKWSAQDGRTYAKIFQQLGTVHFIKTESDYRAAENYLEESIGAYSHMNEKGFVPELLDVYITQAQIKEMQGKRAEADKLYEKCLNTVQSQFGEKHVYNSMILFAIAKKLEIRKDFTSSYGYYSKALENLGAYVRLVFPFLSATEKESFSKKNSELVSNFQAFASLHYSTNRSLTADLFDLQLSNKGIVLQSLTRITEFIEEHGNQELKDLYAAWRQGKNDLVKAYQEQRVSSSQEGWKKVEEKVNDLEKKISSYSEEVAGFMRKDPITWKQIEQRLKPDEAAVELVYIPREINNDTIYAALIVKKGLAQPILVNISTAAMLEAKAVKFYSNAIRHQLDDSRSFDQFWRPVANELKGIKKVFLSADGVYHSINVSTLMDTHTKKYVFDEMDIRPVPSTAILAKPLNKVVKKIQRAVLFTHPNYGPPVNKQAPVDLNRSFTFDNIADLPGTEKERDALLDLFNQHKVTSEDFTGSGATEDMLKKVSSPSILHIATHGFFYGSPPQERKSDDLHYGFSGTILNDNPMLRSGLLLAGCQRKNQDVIRSTNEDGIFTAFEASTLSLSNTQLVVMSACETGLGEIKNGEGVFGLQRAFITAGADKIIMSLWKVDDQATQEFMIAFYQIWLKTNDAPAAFQSAQAKIKNTYPAPYYWGAFILTGN